MTGAHTLIILKAVEITVLHVVGELQCEAGTEVREVISSLANTQNAGIACDYMTCSGGLRVGMHLISCYADRGVKGIFKGPLLPMCAFVYMKEKVLPLGR